MHDLILAKIAETTVKPDEVPVEFQEYGVLVRRCAVESKNTEGVVRKALNALIDEKKIEKKSLNISHNGRIVKRLYVKLAEAKKSKA